MNPEERAVLERLSDPWRGLRKILLRALVLLVVVFVAYKVGELIARGRGMSADEYASSLGGLLDKGGAPAGSTVDPSVAPVVLFIVLPVGFVVFSVVRALPKLRRKRNIGKALKGTWRPLSFSTVGIPGSADFTVKAPTWCADPVARVFAVPSEVLFTQGTAVPGEEGMFYVDSMDGGKPKGLSLHVTANSRTWRLH